MFSYLHQGQVQIYLKKKGLLGKDTEMEAKADFQDDKMVSEVKYLLSTYMCQALCKPLHT